MNQVEAAEFAIKASASLFNDKPEYASVRRRPLLFELASQPPVEPLNREEDLLNKFNAIVTERGINTHAARERYWDKATPYNLTEVFGTCVQFIDQHTAPLPKTTLPPAKDVELFINSMLAQDGPVTVDRQFSMLLDITNNSIIGAANIGMLATRYMSRFSDIRAFPSLTIAGNTVTPQTDDEVVSDIMRQWNTRVARFETNATGRNDGTGDQYYFWTHFFAAYVAEGESLRGKVFQKTFERGNEIMIFAKDKIAKRGGVVSNHYEASLIGRNIGLALAEENETNQLANITQLEEIYSVSDKTLQGSQDEQSA